MELKKVLQVMSIEHKTHRLSSRALAHLDGLLDEALEQTFPASEFVSRLLPQLPRHGLGPIASGQHPSVVTKHDQSPGILLDAGSVD
jgi:hypothetical protein